MNVKTDFVIVITTTDKKEEAEHLVLTILNEKLAACAQVIEVESFYWWKNKLENSKEYRIEFKTKINLYESLAKKLKSIHSYELPEIIVLPIINGSKDYYDWINDETKKDLN